MAVFTEIENVSKAGLCVIFNPAAGKRRAARRLEALRRSWSGRIDFQPTRAAGHAEELAFQATSAGFAVVAAAGGDGTVHEVANGILRAKRPGTRFAVIPIGSANDYADSLEKNFPRNGNGQPLVDHPVDVGRVRAPGGREKYFICCLGLGLNGLVTREARRIKRLQGIALYGLATLRALWYHAASPETALSFDGAPAQNWPTLMLSVLVGRREGGFRMAPAARLDDGWLDYVHGGALSRWQVLPLLLRLAAGAGPPTAHPKVRLGRCRSLQVRSSTPLIVHLDGEFFCLPEDNVRDLEVQILPGALQVRYPFLMS